MIIKRGHAFNSPVFYRVLGAGPDDIELREKARGFTAMSRIPVQLDLTDGPVLMVLQENICTVLSLKCCEKNSVKGDYEDDYMHR